MESLFFPLSAKEAEKAGVLFSSAINRNAGFPTRLRELREKANISQQKLADEILVTKSTIGLYENGDNVPDVKTLFKLATFYGVSADYLLGLSDVKATDTDVKAACEYTGLSENTITRLNDKTHGGAKKTLLQLVIDCLVQSALWPRIEWEILNLIALCETAERADVNQTALAISELKEEVWIKSRGLYKLQPIHKQMEQSYSDAVGYLGSIIEELTNYSVAREIGQQKWLEWSAMSELPETLNGGGEQNAET